MRPLPRLSPSAALLLAVPATVLATWGLLFGAGGLAPGATNLIAAATTIPAAIVLGLIALGRWPYVVPSRLTLVAGGGLAVFAVIAAASAWWSLSAQRSVDQGILSAAYLGALALGVTLGPALARPGIVLSGALTGIATVASFWALLARSFTLTTGVALSPRLSGTLTLPNALAILALAGVFGGLALSAHRRWRWRLAGGAVASINTLALVLTSSRSGLGLALIGAIVLLIVLPAAPRMRLVGIISVVPAIVLGFRVATWNAFTSADRSLLAAGWQLLALTVLAMAFGALLAAYAPRFLPGCTPEGEHRRASRRTIVAAGAGVGLLALAAIGRMGGPDGTISSIRSGFSGPVAQSGVRLGFGSNRRDHWWSTAVEGFSDRPLSGWGAGSFRILEQISQTPAYVTDSAHNSVLEALYGTGLVGVIPFVVSGVVLVAMAVSGARHPRAGDAVGVTVAAVASIAFLAQGLVDVDWSLAAQGVVVYATIGAIATGGPQRPVAITAPGRAITGVLCAVLITAGLFAIPFWLSARDTEQSNRLFVDNPSAALEQAARARSLNPLAVEPLLAEAEAREALGDSEGAAAALRTAIRLEPENYEPWLFYGTFLAFTWGRTDEGRAALERARLLSGDEPSVLTVLESLPPDAAPGGD